MASKFTQIPRPFGCLLQWRYGRIDFNLRLTAGESLLLQVFKDRVVAKIKFHLAYLAGHCGFGTLLRLYARSAYCWSHIVRIDGDELGGVYAHVVDYLGATAFAGRHLNTGQLGVIFAFHVHVKQVPQLGQGFYWLQLFLYWGLGFCLAETLKSAQGYFFLEFLHQV
jgi:hypothetical protein